MVPGTIQFRVSKTSKALSCVNCRKQKRKCTRNKPCCNSCKSRGYTCTYEPSKDIPVKGDLGSMELKKSSISSVSSNESVFSVKETNPLSVQSLLDSDSNDLDLDVSDTINESFWPLRCGNTSTDSEIDPKKRVGGVFPKLFASSLNQSIEPLQQNLTTLHSFLPSRDIADELVVRYKSSIHPVIPLVNFDSIDPFYERCWDNDFDMDLNFYILIFAILYAGSVSMYEEVSFKGVEDAMEVAGKMKYYMGATEIALAMAGFPGTLSIVALQASVILHCVVRNDCKTDDCGSVGTIVRLAQLMELHRDPCKHHQIQTEPEIQTKRLLWWHIFYLDTTTALSSKLPPIIMDGEYDTLLPNEYVKCGSVYKLNQYMVFANNKFRWSFCCNGIMRRSFSISPPSSQVIEELRSSVQGLRSQCASSIEKACSASTLPTQDLFVEFSCSMISSLPDRCHVLLHILFETNKNTSTKDVSSVSQTESPIDEQMISTQIHLLNEFCSHGQMPKHLSLLWEVRKYQPIQAMLYLLRSIVVDLKNSTNRSDLVNDVRVRCLEQAFNRLVYLSEHTTPLCKDRWQLLKELKVSIWNHFDDKEEYVNEVTSIGENKADDEKDAINNQSKKDGQIEDNPIDERYWEEIRQELQEFQDIIDEGMQIKLWDQAAGHYLV